MRIIALIVCFALATPVFAAEPWEGVFTPLDPNEYAESKARGIDACVVGDTDNSPVIVAKDMEQYLDLLEVAGVAQQPKGYIRQGVELMLCVITQVTTVRDMPAWAFDVVCGSESWDEGTWRNRYLHLQTDDPDGMAVYSPTEDGGHIAQLYRCPPQSSPRPKP